MQVQIRTAEGADELTIALDFVISVMNAKKTCSTDTVHENTH